MGDIDSIHPPPPIKTRSFKHPSKLRLNKIQCLYVNFVQTKLLPSSSPRTASKCQVTRQIENQTRLLKVVLPHQSIFLPESSPHLEV